MIKMTKNKLAKIALIGLSALIASSAFALSSGVYVGGFLGYGHINAPSKPQFNFSVINYSFNSGNLGGLANSIYIGSMFAVNPDTAFGVQLGYERFGQANYVENKLSGFLDLQLGSLTINSSGFTLMGVVERQLSPQFDIYFKGGAARVTQETASNGVISVSPVGIEQSVPDKTYNKYAVLPIVELGFGYSINPNIILTAGGSYLFGKNAKNELGDVLSSTYGLSNLPVMSSFNIYAGITFNI